VSVGIDHDTSVFAVATIGKWWQLMGNDKYPLGSNGHSDRSLL
jgi:hypothetical protein